MLNAAVAGRHNKADDTAYIRPLARTLVRHTTAMTPPADRRDGPAEHAVAWVYASVLVAWAEDHGLIGPWLRKPAAARRADHLAGSSDGARGWLAHAFGAVASAHPSTWCLADPRYTALRDGTPPERACRDLLDWWAGEAPSLAYEVQAGPGSLSGWIPGDLLQHLSAGRAKGNALVQTPWWVADFILDQTLRPAAMEWPNTTLHLIDPACGTGHFLIRAVDRLWELYTTGAMTPCRVGAADPEPMPGWTPVGPAEAARRILAGVDGVELDPLTAAVARLRVTVAVASKLAGPGPFRLARIPQAVRPRIVVGDSLLLGVVPRDEYKTIHPRLYAIYESEEELFGRVSWPGEEPAGTGPTAPPPAVVVPRAAEQLDLFGAAP